MPDETSAKDNPFSVWREQNVYNVEKSAPKPKYFIIFAYPAPSGFLHVGTLRSYTFPDVIAKFKRFTGHNVYFPAGIHASGLPSVQFSEKVRSGKYDEYLKYNKCTPEIIHKLSTPEGVVDYFKHNYADIWKRMGFFINEETGTPTSIDEGYQKFIQWQFRTLANLGYLVQKEYTSSFCPNDGPVAIDTAETDLSSGGKAQISEFTVIKFKVVDSINVEQIKEEDIFILTATLRPETVFGVTNIWISPKTDYTVFSYKETYFIVSHESISNIKTHLSGFQVIKELSSNDLINIRVRNPITEEDIPILTSNIVLSDVGTGIVMSVPAHSPVDFLAYKTAIKNGFAIKNPPIVVKSIFKGIPSDESNKKFSVKSFNDKTQLESSISYLNNNEFNKGLIQVSFDEYNNKSVQDVRETIKKHLIESNMGFKLLFFTEPVICRCGEHVQIRFVPDQWFIKYSDSNITNIVKDHIKSSMKIFPPFLHEQMPDIIDWFTDRPCVRTGNWLGTPFPQVITKNEQSKLIIEPIADSTIYPAYYIISKYLHTNRIRVDSLQDSFFDFVYMGKGNPEFISQKTDIPAKVLQEIRKDFETWYPVDCNFGGKEHRTVHFPVYLQMHAMMFPDKQWPKQLFVNWWVMQNIRTKAKIAKSKGGAGSTSQIIEKYSADAIRLYYCHAASPHVDMEWSENKIIMYQKEIEKIKQLIYSITDRKTHDNKTSADLEVWFRFKIQEKFSMMYEYLEQFEIRKMAQECYYSIPKIIWRYINRNGLISSEIINHIKSWIIYLAMITPFMAEEVNKTFKPSESVFSPNIFISKPSIKNTPSEIEEEEFIDGVIDDIIKIKKVIKKGKKDFIYIYTDSNKFPSNKSEEEVLNNAIGYIMKKTGVKPIINSSENNTPLKNNPTLRRPILLFR